MAHEDGSAWPRGCHVFIDESKANAYTLVAATIVASNVATVRSEVGKLRHKGSSSIHMRQESPQQRHKIIGGLKQLQLRTHVVRCSDTRLSDLEKRFRCLDVVLDQCALWGAARLTIELDASIVKHEKQFFVEATRNRALRADFSYQWLARDADPLLWVPDVVAWSHAKGGTWREAIRPLVTGLTEV